MTETLAPGADLKTRTATHGTASLYVDHDAETYYMDVKDGSKPEDILELLDYIEVHGFEVMDEDECPTEAHSGFARYWVCHREGLNDFGFANVYALANGTALLATVSFTASKIIGAVVA